MAENNEHKTVIVDLEEAERAEVGGLSKLERAEASGVLSVNNVSERSRIWNVRVLLPGGSKGTSITEDSFAAGEIDAGAKWETEYDIEVKKPILTLTETYDTCGTVDTTEPHWAYVYGKENPVRITIKVKNETNGEIDNIVINKIIPPELEMLNIENASSGSAEIDEDTKTVIWRDFVVYPKEEATILISAIGTVEDTDIKSAGQIVATYRGEGQQISVLKPDMTALSEFLTGIETAETEPNQWECTLECSNESDLMVRLDKAEVYLIPEDGSDKQKMIDETPKLEMSPSQEWSSTFEIESKSPPKCTQEVVYTPMRTINKRVLGTIEKTPQEVPVIQIDYRKEFDPPEVNSFDKTPVEVTIEVKNTGTARINEFIIEDNLPDDVMPPQAEHVKVWVRGKEYAEELEVKIDPDDQNPEVPHKITFRIPNLKDSGDELEPGDSVMVNYAIMAWRSRPEKEYPSPIRCLANTYPPGLPVESASAEDGHKLGILYKKRSISAKKAINKGADPGEYIVVLVIENKGEVTVENVEVTDWIPTGFDYVSTDPDEESPIVSPTADGTNLVWKWTRMNPGDKRRVNVTVQAGEEAGEYERREPQTTSD
ncbi:MAG: hypothetical protein ACE5H4_05430 [Candidatus Thorarchaeota archaeon]